MKKHLISLLLISTISYTLIGMDAAQDSDTATTGAATTASNPTAAILAAARVSTIPTSSAASAPSSPSSTTSASTASCSSVLSSTSFKDPVIFTTADEQEVIVEKQVAELCQTLKDQLSELTPEDGKYHVPCSEHDFKNLIRLLTFLRSPDPDMLPAETLKTILNDYTTEKLISLLTTAQHFDAPAELFQIILEYVTPRIFDITKLDYLSNDTVCSLLKNSDLKKSLLQQCLNHGLSYFIYQLPWQAKTLTSHTDRVTSVTISSCGKFFVSSSYDGEIKIWDLTSGQCLQTLTGHTRISVYSVAISPCGKFIVSGSEDCSINVWDRISGQYLKTLTGHTYRVMSVAISPCGKFIISASWDGEIRIWDLTSGQCLQTLTGHAREVWSVAISSCGKFIVSCSNDNYSIRIWSLNSDHCLKTLIGHKTYVWSVAISPCGKFIVSGSYDGEIKVWDRISGQCLHNLTDHAHPVTSVTISPCGNFIASGSRGGEIRIWSINTDILNSLTIENVLFLIHVYNCIQNNQSIQTNTLHPALITGMLTLPDALKNVLPDDVKRDIEAYREYLKKLYEDAGLNVID